MVKEEKKRFSNKRQIVQPTPGKEIPLSGQDQFCIVGFGVCTDSLEAIRRYFHNLPSNRGLEFIAIQHFDSPRHSSMPKILYRFTSMPIHVVTDDMKIKPGSIYLIPHDKSIEI